MIHIGAFFESGLQDQPVQRLDRATGARIDHEFENPPAETCGFIQVGEVFHVRLRVAGWESVRVVDFNVLLPVLVGHFTVFAPEGWVGDILALSDIGQGSSDIKTNFVPSGVVTVTVSCFLCAQLFVLVPAAPSDGWGVKSNRQGVSPEVDLMERASAVFACSPYPTQRLAESSHSRDAVTSNC